MRIAFLTNKTATVNLSVYQRLVDSAGVDVAHTFFYDTVSESKGSPLAVIKQFGIRKVLAKVAQAFGSVFRQQIGKRIPTAVRPRSPFEMARIRKLPHSVIANANGTDVVEQIRDLNLDALLVCVCKNILHKELLSLPNMQFINMHPSLLPKYRGPTPTFWMLFHGETETGITFHSMAAKIDAGEILAQRRLPLDRTKSEVEIETGVFDIAATMVEDVLNQDVALTNPSDESSYFTFPTPAQRRELKQRLARATQ